MPQTPLSALYPDAAGIPADYAAVLPCDCREFLLDGELRRWEGPVQEVHSPVLAWQNGELAPVRLGCCPLLNAETALLGLDAACRAYGAGRGQWPTLPAAARLEAVRNFAHSLAAKGEQVVRLMSWEIGKSLAECRMEFDRTMEYLDATLAALAEMQRANAAPTSDAGILAQVRRAPLGVVLCLGPFNFPLNETLATLIPAVLMGNTVLMKTPKLGQLCFAPLLQCFRDSFPPGVVNVLFGESDMLTPVMASGRVDVLAFIGTSRAAGELRALHPKAHRLRCVLGMEAKNVGIVLADADLDQAVTECLRGALGFNGQRCTALKLLFVARGLYPEFLARFRVGMARLKVGMPWEPSVDITPLPEPGKVAALRGLVDDAVALGARAEGTQADAGPTLFGPILVAPVDGRMRLMHEEQFGPLVPVAPFDDIEEPLAYLAGADYGQQASLFGTDPAQLAALVDQMVNQVCRVNLNSKCQRGPDSFPFTGRRDSAEGTLSVGDALRAFSLPSMVALRDGSAGQALLSSLRASGLSAFMGGETA